MSKIYTKHGDKGNTSLLGTGSQVPKSNRRVEAYGNVDELNSWLGLIQTHIKTIGLSEDCLTYIQNNLFTIGSHLSLINMEDKVKYKLQPINNCDKLEQQIDKWQNELPELKNFILPGGSIIVSQIHIARTVCRRAERSVVKLAQRDEVDLSIIQYLNRLSDYLFVLARYVAFAQGVKEIVWKPQ